MTSYEKIVNSIKSAPVTYLPALLLGIVEICIEKKVFRSGTALVETISKIVEKTESR